MCFVDNNVVKDSSFGLGFQISFFIEIDLKCILDCTDLNLLSALSKLITHIKSAKGLNEPLNFMQYCYFA